MTITYFKNKTGGLSVIRNGKPVGEWEQITAEEYKKLLALKSK